MLELSVFIARPFAGYLHRSDEGQDTFRYDSRYSGPPLSLSMSVSNQAYAARVVDAYLFVCFPTMSACDARPEGASACRATIP